MNKIMDGYVLYMLQVAISDTSVLPITAVFVNHTLTISYQIVFFKITRSLIKVDCYANQDAENFVNWWWDYELFSCFIVATKHKNTWS